MIYGLTLQLTHAYIKHITGCYIITILFICIYVLVASFLLDATLYVDGGIITLLLARRSKSKISYSY